jgi:hypothetical protein
MGISKRDVLLDTNEITEINKMGKTTAYERHH